MSNPLGTKAQEVYDATATGGHPEKTNIISLFNKVDVNYASTTDMLADPDVMDAGTLVSVGDAYYLVATSGAADADLSGGNDFYDLGKCSAATFNFYKGAFSDGHVFTVEGTTYELNSSVALADSATFGLGVAGVTANYPRLPEVKRNLAETIDAAMPLHLVPNGLAIEKKRSDFIEYAVYSPISETGTDWARWFSSVRLFGTNAGAPEIGTATLAKLNASAPLFDENRTTGITATTPTNTYNTAAATARVGTWAGSATVGGVTDIDVLSGAGSVTYDVVVPAGGTIYARSRVATSNGIANVTVFNGATEVSAAEYVAQLDGGNRKIRYDRHITGSGLAMMPIARPTAAATYTVEITWESGDVQEGGIEVHDIAFNDVGIHGTALQASTAGSPLSNFSEHSGVKMVYEIVDATTISYKYFANTQGATLNFTVYDSSGTEIASYDTATVNTESVNVLASVTVASNLPVDTYYLHVENADTTTDAAAEVKWISLGAVDPNQGGILGTDTFDILDMPDNPANNNDTGTYTLSGPGNFVAAIEGRPVSVANPNTPHFSMGTHGHETELTNADITVTVDGVVVDYNGAADDTFFYADRKIEIEFSTNVKFLPSLDAAETEFMTVTRKFTYQKGGVVRVETNATDLVDYKVQSDFCLMLQAPNANSTLSDNVGGGYSQIATERSINYIADQSNGTPQRFNQFNECFATYNDKYAVYGKILNTSQIFEQTAKDMANTDNGLVNDLATNRLKGYTLTASKGFTTNGEVTRTAGSTRRVVKSYRIVPFENGDTLLAG